LGRYAKVAILDVQKTILSTEDGKTAAAELKRKFTPKEAKLSKSSGRSKP